MANLTTTYRHDYTKPSTDKLGFQQKIRTGPMAGLGDKCCRECEAKKKSTSGGGCKGGEWTRIGPMGPLIKPRIIPEEPTEREVNRCFKDKPNKFLGKLCLKYPELYEKLKGFPQDEIFRKVEIDRLNTTYQIDFCHQREYPGGSYDNVTSENRHANGEGTELKGACEFYKKIRGNKCRKGGFGPGSPDEDPCQGLYRPYKTKGMAGIPKDFLQSGHWPPKPFQNQPRITEYKDTISRIGRAVMKFNIHDHRNCKTEANCQHRMILKKKEPKICN